MIRIVGKDKNGDTVWQGDLPYAHFQSVDMYCSDSSGPAFRGVVSVLILGQGKGFEAPRNGTLEISVS